MELVNFIRKPLPNPPREGGLSEQEGLNILEEPDPARVYRENADPLVYEPLKGNSRSNRHEPTEAENVLWQLLRRDATGFKIRRQHVIDNYIADFVCLQKGLVIEVDGGYHQHTKEADADRTEMLNHWGFKVIRFTNEEVIQKPQSVFETIRQEIQALPDRQSKVLPPGEDLGGASL
ncbi:endonuclease domain-containing protein [Mucilaginibacter galii]|nr:endonuclease domain-containing protein [Mucilaginibacter galii]